MIEDGWSERCVEMLRECFPELDGTPLYILDAKEVPGGDRGGMRAITSPILSCQMKPHVNDWQGSGFCCVVAADVHRNWHEIESSVLHEVGHHFHPDPLLTAMAEYYFLKGRSLDHPAVIERLEGFAAVPSNDSTFNQSPWDGHDGEYVRCLIHAIHRANVNGWGIDPCDAFPASLYGLRSIRDYAAALGDEPQQLLGETMVDVMRIGPTPAFKQFGDADVARAKASLQAQPGSVS